MPKYPCLWQLAHSEAATYTVSISVVTVAGICNLVGGSVAVFFWHDASGGGQQPWVSTVKAKVVNVNGKHVMSRLRVPSVLECANCSLQETVGGALSESLT